MKRIFSLLGTAAIVPIIAFGSHKDEFFEALGIDGPERESQVVELDLNETVQGKEFYRSFVTYFESQEEPVEFHNPEEINPSTISYQIKFLRKYYGKLIEQENHSEEFLLSLRKWKTQSLIDLVSKMGFIIEWNKSGKETIALAVLHDDLIYAVEGERQMFLSVPEYISKEEDHLLLNLIGTFELDPVLYDELLTHLRSNDYDSARLLNEESTERIGQMDILNQKMYEIFWPSWNGIFDWIEGANKAW